MGSLRVAPSLTAPLLAAPLVALAFTASAEPRVTTFTLENGMEGVVIEDNRAPVVTHMVWYRVGAADEPPGKSGIAHYLEHLMFKGTDEIPEGAFSKIVAENGGQDNAFTSRDFTAYFQQIAADRLDTVMAMEADRMVDLVLSDDAAVTERDVILEERSQRTDNNPGALFSEQMSAALYMNHPYGTPIIGWRAEMEGLSRADALAFYERYYAPDNAILVVAGDVAPEDVEALAEKHFGPLEASGRPRDPRPQEPPQLAPRRLVMEDARVRQPYVLRQYLAPVRRSGDQTDAAALAMLSEVLGGSGVTSRLGKALQVEQGMAISAGAYYSASSMDPSAFGVYAVPAAGVALDDLEAAMDAVIATLASDGPTADELARARAAVRASEIYAQDSQMGLARTYGAALSVGLTIEDVQSWPDVLSAVTAEDVKRAADLLRIERSVTGWLTAPEADAATEETQG
jgi:zinc protease